VSASIVSEVQKLQRMTVGELQRTWLGVFGETSRSRNRVFLWKRLAWELQARVYGRLGQPALDRIQELAADARPQFWPPRGATTEIEQLAATLGPTGPVPRRDTRLPSPGSTIVREYRGQTLRLQVLDDGFELDGVHYDSLSEAARVVTGQRWNGPLFWGLSKRNRNR
jgi:hypothetical protein